MVRKISFYLLVGFYVLAGANHFVDPEFYYPLIPEYFVYPRLINTLSGAIEILLGLALLSRSLRPWAAYAIIAMLVAFIPSHVYFIQQGSCVEEGLCVPQWIGWARLVIIHPLLIICAWKNRDYQLNYRRTI